MYFVLIICNGCIIKNEEVGNRGVKYDYIIIYFFFCFGIGGYFVLVFYGIVCFISVYLLGFKWEGF